MPELPQPYPDEALASAGLPHLLSAILRRGEQSGRLIHVAEFPGSPGHSVPWPAWVPPEITQAMSRAGLARPWAHQAAMAEQAHQGRNVIISTPAASGKSLGYLVPALTAVLSGGTVLYLAPTRALAADQLRAIEALAVPGVCAAVVDGDTLAAERERARAHATYLLTTPDMLHHVLLPRHHRWDGFFGRLRYVIVDECHGYRGVFGSHVSHVLRRLRRIAAHHARQHQGHASGPSAGPVFLLASATISEPGSCARLLTGEDAAEITESAAPRGPVTFGLWEPPLTPSRGSGEPPARRAATTETATLLADLVRHGVRTLAFTRSRRGAEAVALATRRLLADGEAAAAGRVAAGNGRVAAGNGQVVAGAGQEVAGTAVAGAGVAGAGVAGAGQAAGAAGANREPGTPEAMVPVAAYRSGYLADDRRNLEEALRSGAIRGLAATTALELGVNISGLDAVLMAGWPGSRAALWQQAGRAGREGQAAVAVLIARDDPLDTYLVHHPEALLEQPVEATVLDPSNPYVLAPHLCAAAAELPLTSADLNRFSPVASTVAGSLVHRGMLRRRGQRLYWTRRGWGDAPGLRGTGSRPIKIVEETTGRLVGTVDEPSAHVLVHAGAVYPHQGEMYVVSRLDLAESVALVAATDPGYTTSARDITGIDVITSLRQTAWGPGEVHFGEVEVVRQVTAFTRRDPVTGRSLGDTALDLPPRALRTRAVWWTISPSQRTALVHRGVDLPGAAHAAEHTAIGLLPLFAACDRLDIGGVSADLHPATDRLTVFVYDGNEGGAGFAERGFAVAQEWLRATAEAITSCECPAGCPSCVQSPRCGTGNEPLAKHGAILLLESLLCQRTVDPVTARETADAPCSEEGATPAGGESGGRRTVPVRVRTPEPSSREA